MHAKLQLMSDWKNISKNQDGLKLMVLIRNVLHQKDETEQNTLESVQADKALYLCYQKPDQTSAQHLHAFKAKAEVCRSAEGEIPGNQQPFAEKIAKQDKPTVNWNLLTDSQKKEYTKKAETAYLPTLFFTGFDDKRYRGLKSQVTNNWVILRKDNVPTMYEAALHMANGYKSTGSHWPGTATPVQQGWRGSLRFIGPR